VFFGFWVSGEPVSDLSDTVLSLSFDAVGAAGDEASVVPLSVATWLSWCCGLVDAVRALSLAATADQGSLPTSGSSGGVSVFASVAWLLVWTAFFSGIFSEAFEDTLSDLSF